MTQYTEHNDAIFHVGSPVLGATHQEGRDNLKAVAENDPTAPKIRQKRRFAYRDSSGNTTVDGLATYPAFYIEATSTNNNATDQGISVSLSDDGVNFEAATVVFTVTATSRASVHFYVDTSTGTFQGVSQTGLLSGTLAVPTDEVTHVRFNVPAPQVVLSLIVEPNGGNVA